jgi:hypothetical protein
VFKACEIVHDFIKDKHGDSIMNTVNTALKRSRGKEVLKLRKGRGVFHLKPLYIGGIQRGYPRDIFDFRKREHRTMRRFFIAFHKLVGNKNQKEFPSLLGFSSRVAIHLASIATGKRIKNSDDCTKYDLLDAPIDEAQLESSIKSVERAFLDLRNAIEIRPSLRLPGFIGEGYTLSMTYTKSYMDNWFDIFRKFVNEELVTEQFTSGNVQSQRAKFDFEGLKYGLHFGSDESRRFLSSTSFVLKDDLCDDFLVAVFAFSQKIADKIGEFNQDRISLGAEVERYSKKIEEYSRKLKDKIEQFYPKLNKYLAGVIESIGNKKEKYSRAQKNLERESVDSLIVAKAVAESEVDFYHDVIDYLTEVSKRLYSDDDSIWLLCDNMITDGVLPTWNAMLTIQKDSDKKHKYFNEILEWINESVKRSRETMKKLGVSWD